jgi:MFS family permease
MTALNKLTARFYAFSFLDDFMPIYPLYAVMFTNSGVGAAELSALLVTWGATTFFLEIPSGAVGDRFPRKYVLMFGQAMRACGFLVWLLFPTFLGFLIGFIFWGIKSAFTSGTRQAMVFDALRAEGVEDSYTKLSGRMASLKIVGNTIATFLAVAFVATGYTTLLLMSIAMCVVNIIVLATLPHIKKTTTLEEETRYFEYLKGGVHYALRHPAVLRVIAIASVVLGFGALDEHFGVFFNEIGHSDQVISFWSGVLLAVGICMSLIAHRVANHPFFMRGRSMALLVAVWGGVLLLASFIHAAWAPAVIVVFGSFFFLIRTMSDGWLQHSIESSARATVTSVEGFVAELGAIISFVVVGLVAELSSYTMGMRAMAVLIIFVACAALVVRAKSAKVRGV